METHLKLTKWLGLSNDLRLDSEQGFFALLAGLEKKGFRVEFVAYSEYGNAKIIIPDDNVKSYQEGAINLHLALFFASLKALEAEEGE